MKSFARQLLWRVSQILDTHFVDSLLHVSPSDTPGLSVGDDFAAMPADEFNELDNEGIRRTVNKQPVLLLSCAPDKGRVGNMGLSTSPFFLPNKESWWAAPQDHPSHGLQ